MFRPLHRGKKLGFKMKKKRVRNRRDGDDRAQNRPMSKKRVKSDNKKLPSLPLDLIIEILTKLPPKSVSKLICVSKLWSSIVKGKHFTELYLARSSTRPCLFFHFKRHGDRWLHSASQEDPSSDDRAITTQIPDGVLDILQPVRGLICFEITARDYPYSYRYGLAICNPSTSQFLMLPKLNASKISKYKFFGYDPVNDVYKVLCVTHDGRPKVSNEHRVYTLGAQESEWRVIKCKHFHFPLTQGLCKNGVVYYGAWAKKSDQGSEYLLVSFDFGLEEFSLIEFPENVRTKRYFMYGLVNYNGKIALVDESSSGKFEFWVLEDFSKQEWLKFSVSVPSWNDLATKDSYRCLGTVSTGELVFSPRSSSTKFIIYYDPKEDKARRVEFRDAFIFSDTVFLDHVESPMFLPKNFSG